MQLKVIASASSPAAPPTAARILAASASEMNTMSSDTITQCLSPIESASAVAVIGSCTYCDTRG